VIDIWKVREEADFVTYAFGHEGRSGQITINRKTGEATQPAPEYRYGGHAARHTMRS
jgi:hypothetical protein